MNETAKRIGATSSNFVNPHGLHDENHYTTAYDLALISCYSLKNDIFREIVSTKSIEIPWTTRKYNRKLVNKNKMLSNFEGATGIKTGFTKKAGRCLVTSAKRNGMELVSVVLNCPSMWENSANLLNNCFNEYKLTKILDKNNILDFYNYNNKDYGMYIKEDVFIPLTDKEKEDIKIDINYNKNIKIPIKKDTCVGNVCIYLKNNLIFTQKIYNIVDIK
jgi:D-alanyl-D-alanine carboxypeptidase (penicillin-binding protein 5/6)